MKKDNKSQGIGKNIPYQAPEGFFEQISEKTLLKAKLREQNHRRNLTFWKMIAVAASLAAVVLLGFFMYETPTPENELIVMGSKPQAEQVIENKSEIPKAPMVAIVKKDSAKETRTEFKSAETLSDILAELSDEELIQLAAMFKSDPFLDEAMQ